MSRRPTADCVYLIGSPDSRLVKIGTTQDIKARLRGIQNMSPAPLEVLWQTEGGLLMERVLHERFREYRCHGEWFDFGSSDPVELVSEAAADLNYLIPAREYVQQDPLPAATCADIEGTSSGAQPVPRSRGGGNRLTLAFTPPVQVSKQFLLDDRLSAVARGIGAYLLAWTGRFTMEQVAKANRCSPDDVGRALDELADLDYVCIADGKLHFDSWPAPTEHADQHMPGYSEYEPTEVV